MSLPLNHLLLPGEYNILTVQDGAPPRPQGQTHGRGWILQREMRSYSQKGGRGTKLISGSPLLFFPQEVYHCPSEIRSNLRQELAVSL